MVRDSNDWLSSSSWSLSMNSSDFSRPVERAEGANEGPERSQARTTQRKPSQEVILICLQHERLSMEVSRDTSRDMAGEVGRDPLLHVPPSKHGDFCVACKRRLWMNLK